MLDVSGSPRADASGVIVYLEFEEPVPDLASTPASEEMRQVNKEFDPQVLPVVVGSTVDFPNDDDIYHNVFSISRAARFDLGLYKQGESKSIRFDKPGVIRVYCGIHTHMVGYILVLRQPWFTHPEANGTFRMDGLPEGQVTVYAWHSWCRKMPSLKFSIRDGALLDAEGNPLSPVELKVRESRFTLQSRPAKRRRTGGRY